MGITDKIQWDGGLTYDKLGVLSMVKKDLYFMSNFSVDEPFCTGFKIRHDFY